MKQSLTAKKLRIILSVSFAVILIIGVGGFIFMQQRLNSYAVEISKLNADAQSGDQNLQTLTSLEAKLVELQATRSKLGTVLADENNFANQAVAEITDIANAAGVSISGFEYVEADAEASSGTPAAAPATGATSPTATPAQPTTPSAAPAGVKKKAITVNVASPVEYTNLMNFIRGIENNDLLMQIGSVSMSKAEGNAVTTQTYTVEVFVK